MGMSDVGALNDLQDISKTLEELQKRKEKALADRTAEIGQMFAKAGLLEVDDELLRGVIAELKSLSPGQARYAELAQKGQAAAPKRPGPKQKRPAAQSTEPSASSEPTPDPNTLTSTFYQ
jgi:uncharacterized protein YhaN